MALVNTKEMFKKAYEGGYAIGAFNINKLTGMYKMMMGMMLKMLKGKLKEKPGADTDKIMTAFETGVDQVSEDKLSEVIAFLTQE